MSFTCLAARRWVAPVALLVLLLPGSADAQRYKWWQAEHVQRELGLTREQIDRLEDVFQASLPTLRRQKESLDRLQVDLDRAVAKGDHATALAQVDTVESARAALNKSRTLQLVNLRRVLTADQHAKLSAILRDREDERNQRPDKRDTVPGNPRN